MSGEHSIFARAQFAGNLLDAMIELSKEAKRAIRELAGLAYERELSQELERLRKEFDKWKSGALTPFELERKIHTFHRGKARELYTHYTQNLGTGVAVAGAILRGIIQEEEIPPSAEEHLLKIVTLYRRHQNREE
jgi:hypothetical protein